MRILIDQSGYDLLNLGDVAMLQACVARLRAQWPHAEIMVIAHDAQRLAAYCPDTIAIGRTRTDLPSFGLLPRGPRLIAEQAWKMIAPYCSGRLGSVPARQDRPQTVIQAVRAADLVVASGGGYVTDTWWWHAAGVLSLLALAQRLGKPTAMFGQGIGPISQRGLRAQANSVLPGLAALGLREDQIGRDLALSLGTAPGAITVTGDDALELIAGGAVAGGEALGVNVRVARYAGIDPAAASAVGTTVRRAAMDFHAPLIALPVSRYRPDSDLDAIRAMFHGGRHLHDSSGIVLSDLASPDALLTTAVGCRAVVTGSYHAAVFGLAQGVPAVCLTRSSYYDAKFGGLRAQFPDACLVVRLDAPDLTGQLGTAIDQAWHLPASARAAAASAAVRLRDTGRAAYARLRATVEGEPAPVMAGTHGVAA